MEKDVGIGVASQAKVKGDGFASENERPPLAERVRVYARPDADPASVHRSASAFSVMAGILREKAQICKGESSSPEESPRQDEVLTGRDLHVQR